LLMLCSLAGKYDLSIRGQEKPSSCSIRLSLRSKRTISVNTCLGGSIVITITYTEPRMLHCRQKVAYQPLVHHSCCRVFESPIRPVHYDWVDVRPATVAVINNPLSRFNQHSMPIRLACATSIVSARSTSTGLSSHHHPMARLPNRLLTQLPDSTLHFPLVPLPLARFSSAWSL
jgi:hypothetical protein